MATLRQDELEIAVQRLTPQWLAGFFDGEGCVSASISGLRNPRLIVHLTQSDAELLALIALKFGGNGCVYRPIRKGAQHEKKPCYIISFGGKACLPILEFIYPHVILKRKLVGWAIEMAKLTGERGKCGRAKHLPPEVTARRKELMRLVKEENSSGYIEKSQEVKTVN
jgi:hypothetical protein